MRHTDSGIITLAVAGVMLATPAAGQSRPTLHVSTRWEECSIQLDPSLTQSAWRTFTQEAGQLVYFRPLSDARPMGRGRFELALMQWQTNVDDNTSAWNDTFVHPDAEHWLYEGSGLKFPGIAARVGVASRTDVGAYYTKNFRANYGVYAVQLQQNLIGSDGDDLDVSVRGSFMSLFGPEDVSLNVYGADVVTSWKQWRAGRVRVVPYAGVAAYLSASHEKSAAVNLADEQVIGAMGTLGAALQFSVMRVAAEASVSRVPSFALKFGVGR